MLNFLADLFRASVSRFAAALVYPEFRTMWLANLSAQSAAWALVVARGWLVFDLTGSSMSVGIATFAATAPMLIMPPISGVLADRMDRRTLLAWTYAVNLLHNLILGSIVTAGLINEWTIVGLAVINGAARATQMSTSQALAANLVPPERLLNALSLNAATQHASRLVGPGLALPLLGFFGAGPAFFLCTALYGVGWFQIMQIKTRSSGGIRKGESFADSFSQGLRYAWGQPFIRMVLTLVIFHCGLTMAFESLLPNYAAQRLGLIAAAGAALTHEHSGEVIGSSAPLFNAGASGFALLMMGVGVGALFGSILIGGVNGGLARGRLYLAMGLLSGFGQVLLSFAPNLGFALLAVALMGGSQSAFMTMGQAVTQGLAADEYRGRLASINTFSLGGIMSLMNLGNGFLGTLYPAAAILLVNGLIFVSIMAVSAAFATPRRVYVSGMPARALPA